MSFDRCYTSVRRETISTTKMLPPALSASPPPPPVSSQQPLQSLTEHRFETIVDWRPTVRSDRRQPVLLPVVPGQHRAITVRTTARTPRLPPPRTRAHGAATPLSTPVTLGVLRVPFPWPWRPCVIPVLPSAFCPGCVSRPLRSAVGRVVILEVLAVTPQAAVSARARLWPLTSCGVRSGSGGHCRVRVACLWAAAV